MCNTLVRCSQGDVIGMEVVEERRDKLGIGLQRMVWREQIACSGRVKACYP